MSYADNNVRKKYKHVNIKAILNASSVFSSIYRNCFTMVSLLHSFNAAVSDTKSLILKKSVLILAILNILTEKKSPPIILSPLKSKSKYVSLLHDYNQSLSQFESSYSQQILGVFNIHQLLARLSLYIQHIPHYFGLAEIILNGYKPTGYCCAIKIPTFV